MTSPSDHRMETPQLPTLSIGSKYWPFRSSRTSSRCLQSSTPKHEIPNFRMSNREDQFPQGGDLSDMAATGTSVSGDAAKPNYIPSKAKPGQGLSSGDDANHLGAPDLAGAADNMNDMPRVRPLPSSLQGGGVDGEGNAWETKWWAEYRR